MKEPSLEYKEFSAQEREGGILVRYEGEKRLQTRPTVTTPDGSKADLKLLKKGDIYEVLYTPEIMGLYEFEYGDYKASLLYGETGLPEYNRLVTKPDNLSDVARETGGRVVPVQKYEDLKFSLTDSDSNYTLLNTLRFRQSQDLKNRSVTFKSLISYLFAFLLGIFLLTMGWHRQE